MFEKAVLSDRQRFRGIDPGLLAEFLIYYDKVQVTCTASDLAILAERIGIDTTVELLKIQHLSVVLDELDVHFFTESDGIYRFSSTGALSSPEMLAGHISMRLGHSGAQHRKKIDEMIDLIEFRSDYTPIEMELEQCAAAAIDWLATSNAAIELLFALSGQWDIYREAQGSPLFRVTNMSGLPPGAHIETNIAYLNKKDLYDKRAILRLACQLLRNVSDAKTAAADMAVTDQFSQLLAESFSRALRAPIRNDVRLFEEVVLGRTPAVAEAIRTGHRSYSDLLSLLEKKQKFTNWMKGRSPEKRLVDEYFEAVRRQGWLSAIPGKVGRYSFFTGAGLLIDAFATGGIATATAIGGSAIDAFLLDPLTRGWRPDHFVEGPLRKFVAKDV